MNSEPAKEDKRKRPPRYIGAGLAIGAGVGIALDNIAVGIAIGLAIGVALQSYHKEKNATDEDEDKD